MNNQSIPVTFAINKEITDKDTRFLHITIDVLHIGENFNQSVFEKEIVDSCVDSIKNTAILGFIQYDTLSNQYDFKGHEYLLTKTEQGVEESYLGSAYGVIPESCNPRWIKKVCDDGKEREFLQVDALLWTKFEESIAIMNRDFEKSQSMELEISSVEGYEDEDGLFHFTKFKFDGCCLLGDKVDPAMINSIAQVKEIQFMMNHFIKNIQKELKENYISFTKMVNQKEQGGTTIMSNTKFTQTVMQQFEDISNMVKQHEIVKDRWGDYIPRYYAMDIQDNEVIVTDRANNYQYYGLPFTMNGDKAEIDFTKGIRKKLCYANYEEGVKAPQGSFDFGKHIAELEETAFQKVTDAESKIADAEEKVTTVETKYSIVKKDYDKMKTKYDAYVEAEQKQRETELEAKKDAMLERFEKELGENTDFIALKENKSDLSVDEIETKCSLLYTRNRMKQEKDTSDRTNFSKSGSAVIGIMDEESAADEGRNYIPTKYGNIPINR